VIILNEIKMSRLTLLVCGALLALVASTAHTVAAWGTPAGGERVLLQDVQVRGGARLTSFDLID
jgi:hypothetical protein